MSLYLNITRKGIRAKLADGTDIGFDPHKAVFVAKEQMSASIQYYINNKTLRYRGGDGVISAPKKSRLSRTGQK